MKRCFHWGEGVNFLKNGVWDVSCFTMPNPPISIWQGEKNSGEICEWSYCHVKRKLIPKFTMELRYCPLSLSGNKTHEMHPERVGYAIYFNYPWFQNTGKYNKNAYVHHANKALAAMMSPTAQIAICCLEFYKWWNWGIDPGEADPLDALPAFQGLGGLPGVRTSKHLGIQLG